MFKNRTPFLEGAMVGRCNRLDDRISTVSTTVGLPMVYSSSRVRRTKQIDAFPCNTVQYQYCTSRAKSRKHTHGKAFDEKKKSLWATVQSVSNLQTKRVLARRAKE